MDKGKWKAPQFCLVHNISFDRSPAKGKAGSVYFNKKHQSSYRSPSPLLFDFLIWKETNTCPVHLTVPGMCIKCLHPVNHQAIDPASNSHPRFYNVSPFIIPILETTTLRNRLTWVITPRCHDACGAGLHLNPKARLFACESNCFTSWLSFPHCPKIWSNGCVCVWKHQCVKAFHTCKTGLILERIPGPSHIILGNQFLNVQVWSL